MLAAIVLAAVLDVHGHVAARGASTTGPRSWLEGGWGRLDSRGGGEDFFAVSQVGIDWTPSTHFSMHVSGVARREPTQFAGDAAGLVDAYADLHATIGLDGLRLRAGQFFLPTSRENIDALWTSPYSLSFSALNTWIGEEVRPVGADLQYVHATTRGHLITGALTAFRGNDTMGALLAWRGWSIGNRLTTTNEVLPLPHDAARFFPAQRADGTKPFGVDLDGRTGISARLRYAIPTRASLQYTFVDNRADRALHRGEYAWATSFHLLGAEAGDPDAFSIAGEYMRGKTGMGARPHAFVDADFDAAYILLSEKSGRNRWTVRYELFATQEKDFSPAERNDESGRAWTLTWMVDLRPSLRLAGELAQFSGHRADTTDPDGHSFTIEARYGF